MRFLHKLVVCVSLGLFTFPAIYAQERTVTGTVTDELGDGMPGVSVIVKGTPLGAATDLDGNYTLKVTAKDPVLVFSFIGYKTQEIPIGNRERVDVQMKEDTQTLDEVVVVAYGTARKGDVTGALQTVKPTDNDHAVNSINGLLDGKVAGLVVNASSSAVGAASSVTIRGANSLRGDNQPLYVIDNIPQASTGDFAGSTLNGDYQVEADPLAGINPSDILDITVLKDASSTAIYGSRGANGVILITTKKGKAGDAKVNVGVNFTVAQPTKFLRELNLVEFAAYSNMKLNENQWRYHVVGNEVRYHNDNENPYDASDPSTYTVIKNRNWQEEVYKTSFSQNYSVAVSGGSDKVRYYASVNFKDIKGTVRGTDWIQGDLRSNLTANLSKTVKMNLIVGASLRENNMMPGGNNVGGATGGIAQAALMYVPYALPANDPLLENNETLRTTVFNWLDDYVDKTSGRTLNASLDLTWDITSKFKYQLRTGGNMNNSNRKRWFGQTLYAGYNGTNFGKLTEADISRSNYTIENLLMFNSTIKENTRVDATVGVTYDTYKSLVSNTYGYNFTFLELKEKGMSNAGDVIVYDPVQADYQLLSYLGRVNFSIHDKYLITASFRADGSSKFSKGNRWGFFPSASFAWRMEQEDFLNHVQWVSQLKPRISYGVTGNQAVTPYMSFSSYGSSANGLLHGYGNADGSNAPAFVVTNIASSDLTWETTTSWNIGVDFGFFNNRLSGSIDFYEKTTKNLLLQTALPGSSAIGDGTVWFNRGKLSNKGMEIAVNGQILAGRDWQWSVTGNIGLNSGKIKDLGLTPTDFSGVLTNRVGYLGDSFSNQIGGATNIFLEGEAPGLFFGYKTQGVVQNEDIVDGKIRYTKPDGTDGFYTADANYSGQAGDIKFVDANGDGKIDAQDKVILGNPNPDFTYGFSTNLTYKNLSLAVAFNGVHGIDRLNYNSRILGLPKNDQSSNILLSAYQGIWTPENASNKNPRANYVVGNYLLDRYIEDASYLRCSDITLTYLFPKKWMQKIHFNSCTVAFSVKNAFTVTDYSGYDPEVNSFAFKGTIPGVDMSSYPSNRSYVLSINLNF